MEQRTDHLAGALPAPRIVSGEVIPRGDTAPAPTLTDAQLATLIGMAARPTTSGAVIHHGGRGSRGGHPGINVTLPTPDYVLPTVAGKLPEAPTTRTWAPMGVIASAGALLAGPAAGILAGSDLLAAALCMGGFAGGVRSLVILLRHHQQG